MRRGEYETYYRTRGSVKFDTSDAVGVNDGRVDNLFFIFTGCGFR